MIRLYYYTIETIFSIAIGIFRDKNVHAGIQGEACFMRADRIGSLKGKRLP